MKSNNDLTTYHLFKMTKSTPCFKKGQKVWVPTIYRGKAYGRLKGTGKWISAFIRPYAFIRRYPIPFYLGKEYMPFVSNHGSPNAKYIDSVQISGYLNDLFTVMQFAKRNHRKITLKRIGYNASAIELLDMRHREEQECQQEKNTAVYHALEKQKEAMIKEVKERFGIDLTDPCDNMSISEMRKLPWMKR